MALEAWFMRHRTDTSPSCHKSFILGYKNEEKPLKSQGKVEGCFTAPVSVLICAVCCRKAVSPQSDLAKAPFPNVGFAGSQKGAACRGPTSLLCWGMGRQRLAGDSASPSSLGIPAQRGAGMEGTALQYSWGFPVAGDIFSSFLPGSPGGHTINTWGICGSLKSPSLHERLTRTWLIRTWLT